VARALFSLNDHFGTVLALLDEKDVRKAGCYCPVRFVKC
jgi:hypothetical protein